MNMAIAVLHEAAAKILQIAPVLPRGDRRSGQISRYGIKEEQAELDTCCSLLQ